MSRFDKPLPKIVPGPHSPISPIDADFQRTINQAWSQNATFQKDDLSKSQKKIDNMIDQVSNVVCKTQSAYESVNAFYSANQSVFAAAASSLANLNGDSTLIEATMSAFTEYCPIVLKGLDSLGQLHPFIGVATKAFSLVITMDLTRRQNNKKVIALKMQMQDTMMILFDLRHMKDPDHTDAQGNTMENRMSALLKKIAQDITEAGSACDHYIKKSFVAKTLKSMKYESRLAAFGDEFVNHRKNLKLALSIHTALGVDTANTKLDSLSSQTKSLQSTMAEILRKLDTPRERATKEFIEEQGGPKACLQDDQLVQKLIDLSGESVSAITSRKTGDDAKDIEAARKQLTRDFAEDLDKAFERNLTMFERKMEMQNKQMETFFEDSLHNEGQLIIAALKAGSYGKIVDEDMQALWKENEWKGSVKARHFVLALQDFYADKTAGPGKFGPTKDDSGPAPTASLVAGGDWGAAAPPKDDRWALKYLDVSRVQPILEAIDDDGTGFISIKEVNDFATSKPEGWSLPLWIAYWAAGWHIDIVHYKRKIHAVMRELYKVLDYDTGAPVPEEKRNIPANRSNMDLYLCDDVFGRIDLLLRSLQPLGTDAVDDAKLKRIIDEYSALEENRLKENLEGVAYDIDTPATVALVTGPGRIERFILPLIYLLLKRHLNVFYVAQTHVLHEQELSDSSMSLHNIFVVLDDRIEGLGAIFKQTVPDVSKRLNNFAFGLLQLSYVDRKPNPRQNSFRPWNEEGNRGGVVVSEAETPEAIAQIPMSILKYGLRDTLESQIYEHSIATFNPNSQIPRTRISGYWAGHLWSQEVLGYTYAYEGLIQIFITKVDEDGTVEGTAEGFHGLMSVSGQITEDNNILLAFEFEDGSSFFCTGEYDPSSEVLTGQFDFKEAADDEDSDDESKEDGPPTPNTQDNETSKITSAEDTNIFFFNRTPAFAWRFHPLYGQASRNPRERWSFALNAVLDEVRRKRWSWSYLQARNAERRRFLELKLREEMHWSYTPALPLSKDEGKELQVLIAKLHPTDAHFYFSLVFPMIETTHISHPDCICDICDSLILKSRHICLVCISEEFYNTFDTCSKAECRKASGSRDTFTHVPSHALLKVDRMILDGEKAWAIPKAQDLAARIKEVFHTKHLLLNPTASESAKGQDKTKSKETLCCCCAKEVDTPCWVCLYCARDTYICNGCEAARTPVLQDLNSPNKLHEHKHFLVRIYDDAGSAELLSVDTRLLSLETKLAGVETRLETFEHRFCKLENMLQRVLEAVVPGLKAIQ